MKTEKGLIIPKGNDTAVFIVLSQINPLKYCKVMFEDTLYLPNIDVNLFSGLKYYKSGGYLEKNRLYTPQRGIIARLNIIKTGFFILLKSYKSNNAFTNFCYSFHKDDFFIPIPSRPLKAGSNKSNALEGVTSKPGPHRPKDRHRSKVSKGVNTGDNNFKDPRSWESIKKRPRISEDKPCKPVKSQEVTIGPEQASINGLNLETSRGTARKRPHMPIEPRDEEKTDDLCRNPKSYNVLLQLVSL